MPSIPSLPTPVHGEAVDMFGITCGDFSTSFRGFIIMLNTNNVLNFLIYLMIVAFIVWFIMHEIGIAESQDRADDWRLEETTRER